MSKTIYKIRWKHDPNLWIHAGRHTTEKSARRSFRAWRKKGPDCMEGLELVKITETRLRARKGE